ncbi:methyltransferase domain-containing protein [Streptomyces sp. NRRL F-5053]|uniref:methyltransferase domain-containing protein n=1 Tax=Streptomyces sp. NRRL F-5053 TaxID=1463854 RepID=UPI0004CC2E59|nr:methyltransferase domain-containing protein [Streptomyces sp. NRRL F-5053]
MITPSTVSAEGLRRRMVQRLTDEGALRTPKWREAFEAVPRELFVPRFTKREGNELVSYLPDHPGYLEAVYSTASLNVQYDQHGTATSSSSNPTMMALMLEALAPADDELPVLDLGTGPGYNAALLCHAYGPARVVTRDVDPRLVTAAAGHLADAGYAPSLTVGDGTAGCPDRAPYSAVIATFGVGRIPNAWREQVVRGGNIVANVGHGLIPLTIGDQGTTVGRFLPTHAAFMRARPTADTAPAPARSYAGKIATASGSGQEIELPAALDEDMPRFLGALAHPDVIEFSLVLDGQRVFGLVHPDSDSWARVTPRGGGTAQLDHGGPRDLWAERAPLLGEWTAAGRPGADAYTLTVHPDGRHQLAMGGRAWPLP